jgi:hypothetical protein
MASRGVRRAGGGRIRNQFIGLVRAAPFVLLVGSSSSVRLLIVGPVGAGLRNGIYDANIFASVHDAVQVKNRETAAGLTNTVGWKGGLVAPIAIGIASESFCLGVAVASKAIVNLQVGALAQVAARVADARHRKVV